MEEMKNKSAASLLSIPNEKKALAQEHLTMDGNDEAHSSQKDNGDESEKADSDDCQIETGKRVQEQDAEGSFKDNVDRERNTTYEQRQLKKTMRQRGGKLIEQLFSQTNKRTVHLLEQQTEEFFKLSTEFKNRLAAGTSGLPDVSSHAASMMPKFSRAQFVNFLKTSRVPIFAGDGHGNSDVRGSQINQPRAQHLDSLLRGTPSGSLMQARASVIAARPETDHKLAERCSSGSIIQRSQLIDFLRSSDDDSIQSSSRMIPQWQRVCRICYQGGADDDEAQDSSSVTQKCSLSSSALSSKSSQGPEAQLLQNQQQQTDSSHRSSTKKERLLTRICKCKGSLSFVHESCLLKWIDQCGSNGGAQGGKRCEICLQEYMITYEFDSFQNIVRNGMNYALGDKKRLIRGLLYALYLWIFYRRFLHMIRSAFAFAFMSWIGLLEYMLYGQKTGVQKAVAIKPTNEVRLRLFARIRASASIQSFIGLLIKTVSVLYRVFIFVQMCLLGIGESIRLKKYAQFLIQNAKRRTVSRLRYTD